MKLPVWSRVFPEGAGNYRRRRMVARGRRDAVRRAADATRSRLPGIRNRVSPATGRPHADDAEIGRRLDKALARMKADREEVRAVLARSQEADRTRVREHADRVLGPGRADRAAEALRQARVNPWEDREPAQRGRSR
jgi:hypothetical protein